MIEKVRTGLAQMQIDHDFSGTGCRKLNIERACGIIAQMAVHKPDMIVLPDEFYAGAAYGQFSPVETLSTIEQELFEPLKKLAREHSVFIISSVTTLLTDDDLKAAHIGFIIDHQGNFLGFQEKLHIVKSEALFIKQGKEMKIFDTPFGKLGLLVANDILFPEVARKLVLAGAEILIAPTMAPGLNDGQKIRDKYNYPNNLYKTSAMARAFENQVFVVMANGVGTYPHINLPLAGNSMVCGPLGPIYEASEKQDLAIVDINRIHAEEAQNFLPLMAMRNKELQQL